MATVTATRTSAQLVQAIRQAIAEIDALEKGLGIKAPKLSPSDKRHTARYRKGGDEVISTIGSVAQQHRLDLARMPVSEMNEQMALADAVATLEQRVRVLQIHLADVIFSARAGAWQTAMQYYALLQRMARSNGEIAKALEPVKKFMSVHDPREKRQVGEPTRPAVRAAKKAQRTLARLEPLMAGRETKKK